MVGKGEGVAQKIILDAMLFLMVNSHCFYLSVDTCWVLNLGMNKENVRGI